MFGERVRPWWTMKRAQRTAALKLGIIALGAAWRMAMIPSWVEVLFGVTPYLAIVSAWDFLKRPWVIGAVVAIVAWSDVSACLAARRAIMATSSTAGVALIMQFLFALCVVGAAVVLTFLFPSRRRR